MILARYFVREMLKLSAAIVAGLFILYLSMRFAGALGEAADGKVAPQHIARIVGLKMLVSLKDLLPMALLLGSFGAITRLQLSSEWVAMRAAGISHQQLLRPALTLSGVCAIIVGLVTLLLAPKAEFALRELREQTENEATIAGVKAGRFREMGGGSRVFYAESISADQKYLENAFVRTRSGDDEGAMRSSRAFVESDIVRGDRYAVFEAGKNYSGQPGRQDYVVTDFDRYAVRIENRDPPQFGLHVGFVPTGELLQHEGSEYAIELQWRLALPVCTLLAPGLAVLIGLGRWRGTWYLGLITTVSAYFAYTNVLGVGRALMKKGVLPPMLGLWPIHLAFVALLVLLFLWQRQWLRLPRRTVADAETLVA